MPNKIVIVGGGLAGTIIANGLCRQLGTELRSGEISITMLGAAEQHMYQPGLLYVPFGRIRERDLFRDQTSVLDKRVSFHIDPVTKIEPDSNGVTTESGTLVRLRLFGYRDRFTIESGSSARHA